MNVPTIATMTGLAQGYLCDATNRMVSLSVASPKEAKAGTVAVTVVEFL